MPKLTENEKLVQITFDEMYTKKKVGWDPKMDALIGPGTKMQCIVLRSLTGIFKLPFFFGFDRKMTKKLLNETIYVIESLGLKNLLTVCDQAGENVGLQNALKVTVENNTFPNPFDPSRFVFYTYDFWHSLKNLRYTYIVSLKNSTWLCCLNAILS